ncbi:MAG: SO2930 family diheme c-type cytochrome [Rhizobiaceae bacterium]
MALIVRSLGLLLLLLVGTATGNALERGLILEGDPPKLLSEYGFFSGEGIGNPARELVPYELVTPLFTDYALKYRHVLLPEGEKAGYVAEEVVDFPVGSVLLKTFAYPADFRKPEKNVRPVETRLLLHRQDGWLALAYVWNADLSDAELKVAGKRLPVQFIDGEGVETSFEYAVPNKNQCKGCHALNGAVTPIGPKARNLNRQTDYGAGPVGQAEHWIRAGMIEDAPDPAAWPKATDWLDSNAGIDARARTWLDVNCAHCHRREGPASNSGLFLTSDEKDRVALGVGKRPVAAGRGAGEWEFDIVPGDPEASILYHRVASTEPGVMMPELGRTLKDHRATELLREWILTLD